MEPQRETFSDHAAGIVRHSQLMKIRDLEVDNSDVERVIETAQAITLPPDQQVLHTLVQEYIIDDQYDIREPRGMSGMRLEVKVHIVSGAIAAAQNIVKCIKRSGLDVMELILQPLASADAVLTNDEKELGVCLIDIGLPGLGSTKANSPLQRDTPWRSEMALHRRLRQGWR